MLLKKNGLPLYYQIENIMRENILRGEWKIGTQIPTEPQLMEMFGVSRATMRQAISDLCNEGLLNRIQGKGTFVAEGDGYGHDPTEIWEHTIPGTFHRALSCEDLRGSKKKSKLLNVDPDETFTVFSYLHCVNEHNNEPYNLCVTYFPQSRFLGIKDYFYADSVCAILKDVYHLSLAYTESEFRIVNLKKDQADQLGVKANTPTILVQKVYYDRMHSPVFCTDMFMHPTNSVLRITTDFK